MDPETARGGRAMDKIQIDDVDKAGEDNVKIDLNMQSSPSPTTARGGQGADNTPMQVRLTDTASPSTQPLRK